MSAPARTTVELPGRGIALSVIDFGGRGDPALLCHANGFCAALWAPVAAVLARTHRVFAFDSRGHGESSKPAPPEPYRWSEFVADLIAVAERIRGGARPAQGLYAIGHSFAGTAAIAAVARRPELFSRIALLDPVLRPPAAAVPNEDDPEWKRRLEGLGVVRAASRRRERFDSRDEVRARYAKREPFSLWDPGVFELYVQAGFADEPGGSVRLRCPAAVETAIYRMNDLDPYAQAEKLGVPGLLLFAARGRFARAHADEIARRAPRMRVEDVDAGHLFPMELPEPTAQRLQRFAAED